MKKFFALFLVLCLAGPAVALACNCCHGTESNPAHPFLQSQGGCRCPAIQWDREGCAIERSESWVFPSSRISISPVFSNGMISAASLAFDFDFQKNDSSPPSFSSETPLYLAHQILRL